MNMSKFMAYLQLMRLHRPIGILLLLWPTLWALWIAGQGKPNPLLLIIFILGVIIMRSAGCVINDFADRHFDGQVTRTQARPLVTRAVSTSEALILFTLLCAFALLLLWPLNALTRFFAIPAALLATVYPFMKRYTHLPQLILGLAFSWGIPMAFAAQTGHVPNYAWLLFFTACLWPIAYDTIYAIVDREDDKKAGIKSTAILFGNKDTLIIALLHISMLMLLALLGLYLQMSFWYFLGLIAAGGVMIYEQILICSGDMNKTFRAFQKSQWAGCAIFVGIFLSYLR